MANQYAISKADLSRIDHNLSTIYTELNDLGVNVYRVDDKVSKIDADIRSVYGELEALAGEFHDYVYAQVKANRLGQAETRLVKIRQELERKYGHYEIVRRISTGVLQADDLELVKRTVISDATEEVMISTPNYWLAPCLVALAAWINDQPGQAEKALREAIRRDDEKTSLFFALVCRRSGRKESCLKWVQRYMENQDYELLDRKVVIILDAYAGGFFGSDSEGVVAKQIDRWLKELSLKSGFTVKQVKQWSDAIQARKKPYGKNNYPYLSKYSPAWQQLCSVMGGAMLHEDILCYFKNIFEQELPTGEMKRELDGILTHLVTDFDDEELPLRKEEKFEQFIVDSQGDEKQAKSKMQMEQAAFEEKKDFTQLLTDAAMCPESAGAKAATQKLSIALSREWISEAYRDIVAKNRMAVPHEIEIKMDNFSAKTINGDNEKEIIESFNRSVESEKLERLRAAYISSMVSSFQIAGPILMAISFLIFLTGYTAYGVIGMIVGGILYLYYRGEKSNVERIRANAELEYEKKRESGIQVIRALLAEVVDFRREFAEHDAVSGQVMDFLDQIRPEQYIRRISDSSRKIKV